MQVAAANIRRPDPARRLITRVCWGGIACLVLLSAGIAAQGVSGALVACASRQDYPVDEGLRADALRSFASLSGFHSVIGHLMLIPALFIIACGILYSIHCPDFEAKCTKHPWAQTVRAVFLAAVVTVTVYWGSSYADDLQELKFWLSPPSGGYPAGTEVARGQVVSASTFSTFIVIHGILLPLVMILVMITMWPGFHEFVTNGGPDSRNKWANIADGRVG